MVMLTDFNQQIIPNYSPISARGGSKSRRSYGRHIKKRYTRRHKKSNKSRTRRRYR